MVVSYFDAVPAFVAVHCVETADDACNVADVGVAMLLEVGNKALTALRVGVAAVHKAVNESVLDAVNLGNVDELEQVVER